MSQLGNSLYKRKTMTDDRVKGFGGLALSWGIYSAFSSVAMITGAWAPTLALAASASYTLRKFGSFGGVKSIEVVEGGKVKIEI